MPAGEFRGEGGVQPNFKAADAMHRNCAEAERVIREVSSGTSSSIGTQPRENEPELGLFIATRVDSTLQEAGELNVLEKLLMSLISARNHSFLTATSIGVLFALTCSSCSFGPKAVRQPSINAGSAGSKAMEIYDKNSDGVVSGDELERAPSLKAALSRLDTNGDKGVSADEVAERVNAWKAMQSGMTGVHMHITMDGRPLSDAIVTLEPEEFLGGEVKKAFATSTQTGDVSPTIPKEERPDPTLPGGANFGLYKVRISKMVNGKETIPAKYNTETILGQEISYDDPGMKSNNITFALKSTP